jgi:CRISPR/Cas system-associated endonuclease/helicase Cas3
MGHGDAWTNELTNDEFWHQNNVIQLNPKWIGSKREWKTKAKTWQSIMLLIPKDFSPPFLPLGTSLKKKDYFWGAYELATKVERNQEGWKDSISLLK